MIWLNLLIIDIACTFAVFMLLLYLYGEGNPGRFAPESESIRPT